MPTFILPEDASTPPVSPDEPDQNPADGTDGNFSPRRALQSDEGDTTEHGLHNRAIPVIPLTALNQEPNAPGALKVISQPTDVPNLADISTYAYQNEPPGQVRVYIIDTGDSPQSVVRASCVLSLNFSLLTSS